MRSLLVAVSVLALATSGTAGAATYPLGWHERYFASGGELDIAIVVKSLRVQDGTWRVTLSVRNGSALSVDVRPRFALVGVKTYPGQLLGADPPPLATGATRILVVEGRGTPHGRFRLRLGAFFQPLVPGLGTISWLSRRSVLVH